MFWTDLYDDHTQNFATGCPRLAAMSKKDKNVIVRKAKLCIYCLDPEFVYNPKNYHKQCPVQEKKRHYTCRGSKCLVHYWLCDYKDHGKFNAKKLQAEKKLWSGRGKLFSNACSKVGEGAKKKEKKNVSVGFDTNSQPKSLKESPVVSSVPKERNSVHQTNQQKCCIKEATEKLKDVAKGTKVFEVPEGEPLFLFSYAVGKNQTHHNIL